MYENYQMAYTEVYEILKYLNKKDLEKIPSKLIKFFHDNKSNSYKYIVDISKPFNEQTIRNETKDLLACIYRDYACNDEQKKVFDKIIIENEKEYQKNLTKEHNPNDISKKPKNIESQSEKVFIAVYKESICKKIVDKIKKILNIHNK